MAVIEPLEYIKRLPTVRRAPQPLNIENKAEADVLYVSFGPPRPVSDSELSDDDILVRYDGDEVIGDTIMNASKRAVNSPP